MLPIIGSGATVGKIGKAAEGLKFSNTVLNHANDISRTGELARPYLEQGHIIAGEIMNAGNPVQDVVSSALKWVVPGSFNNKIGNWELVVDMKTDTVIHFLFRGKGH